MAKCNRLGCLNKAVSKGFCGTHAQGTGGTINSTPPPRVRPSYHHLYDTAWWKRVRKQILNASPLCVRCAAYNKTSAATDVDHVVSHKGDEQLFYDTNNLQPLCRSCHSWKTNQEEGGRHRGLDFRNVYDK